MQHLDEAREAAESAIAAFLTDRTSESWRVLLVVDVFGRLRVVLWCPDWKRNFDTASADLAAQLASDAGAYWSGEVLRGVKRSELPDGLWQDDAWASALPIAADARGRVLERHRAKTGWFEAPSKPPWRAGKGSPAVVLFYSFKGGVGRSTALAATALNLASAGDRVVVIDADLDAPGVGGLLAGDASETARWGVVDYLLEQPVLKSVPEDGGNSVQLEDYYHRCPASLFAGSGEILVFPSGRFDSGRYLDKLARLDYGAPSEDGTHPFVALLEQIRSDLAPDWILVDSRAGLGDVSGFLTGGVCHAHVLLGTLSESSWQGLELVLERLGADPVRRGQRQADTIMVAAMVPRSDEAVYRNSVARFTDRARDVFSERYYAAPDPALADSFWTLDDIEGGEAPHVPIVLRYDERLALFRDLTEVAAPVLMEEEPYRHLAARVRARFEEPKGNST